MGLCQYVDLCFHASSLPCLHTFWHAIPTSFYIFNVFYFLVSIERLQGVWPKIIPVAMEMPIFYVNFSSLNYPNLNDESLEPYG